MQAVLRRTALAKAQAARRAAKRRGKNASDTRLIKKDQVDFVRRAEGQDIRKARKARREDWELGPLAPRRDVGDLRDTYGTVDSRRIQGIDKPRKERTRFWNIVEGDRVVLLEGRDKGKIGEVKSVSKEKEEVLVRGLNMVDVVVPDWLKTADPNASPVQSLEHGIPLASVRLVHALTDPETGQKRDVIVKKIATSNIWFDRQYGTQTWSRFIAGLDIKIPWPKKPPTEHKDTEADTLRIDVESQTWVPTLLRPPMPMMVMDELRNKYSKFRDRHDEDYIALKTAEDEGERLKEEMGRLMTETPVKQKNREIRKEKRKMGRGSLTPSMLSRIGEIMSRNKGVPVNGEQHNALA
ncbi:MAG: hypothetical protein M1837_000856 [Sclerophora amabilis]|nr:MAG: hypothetical protein M1837_000856 [Sclerophora amabilis]